MSQTLSIAFQALWFRVGELEQRPVKWRSFDREKLLAIHKVRADSPDPIGSGSVLEQRPIGVVITNWDDLKARVTSVTGNSLTKPHILSISKRDQERLDQMQQQFTEMHPHLAIRHFLDSNALVLWVSGVGVLATTLALPAFL